VKISWPVAISVVKSGRSIREIGRAYRIAQSTIQIHMKAGVTSTARLGRRGAFTADQE
jgi:hypothetical protein